MGVYIHWEHESPTGFKIKVSGRTSLPNNSTWSGTSNSPNGFWATSFNGISLGIVNAQVRSMVGGYSVMYLRKPSGAFQFQSPGAFSDDFANVGHLKELLPLTWNGFDPSPGQVWKVGGEFDAKWKSLDSGAEYEITFEGHGPPAK